MKRVISLILCLMLVLGMATTASAATVINETGHAYQAYQVFSGTQAEGSVNLGNVQWGSGVNGDALLAELKDVYDIYDSCTSAAGVAGILAADSPGMDKDTDAKNFANIAAKHLTTTYISIADDATSVDLPTGYYLLVDVTEVDKENDANNPALLQVTNAADVKIAKKYTVPSVDKNILIANGEKIEPVNISENNIGDTINFELKATLPNNLADYDTYKLVFHDSMSAGLTFGGASSVTVKDGSDVIDTSYYTVKTSGTHDGDCTFEIVFEDIKAVPGVASDDVIYVTYTAKLNEDAVIDSTGNPNEVTLEFSNDPNWDPDDHEPTDVPPTGFTPPSEVIVYTTEVTLVKKDGTTKNVLTGAEFKLTGDSARIAIITTYEFEAYTGVAPAPAEYKYWKLNNGTYTETDPATPGVDASGYADINTKYKMTAVSSPAGPDAATPVEIKAYVGEDGRLTFSGLGVGTYTISETVTPDGYNTVQDITLHVAFVDGAFQYTWSGGASGATQTITVNNYKGSTLPETGGMGTTLFYVVGGLMVAAAAILLITKKRMSTEV